MPKYTHLDVQGWWWIWRNRLTEPSSSGISIKDFMEKSDDIIWAECLKETRTVGESIALFQERTILTCQTEPIWLRDAFFKAKKNCSGSNDCLGCMREWFNEETKWI